MKKKPITPKRSQFYLQILRLFPEDASVYNNLGADYFELQKFDEAISALKKSIALDPKYEKAYFNLGSVYWHLKQTNEAVSLLQKAVALNPQYKEAHTKLCDIFLASDQTEEAVVCYKKLILLAPQDAQSNSNYGVALMKVKSLKKPLNFLKKTTKTFRRMLKISIILVLLCSNFVAKRSRQRFNRALEIEPNN